MTESVKILVVDDNASVRNVFTSMLNTRGFQVVTAEDGLSGLKTAEAELPDLIITDIDMPHLDGLSMIARLRKHPELREVLILVVSAFGNRNPVDALKAGASQTMPKPVDFHSFMGLISQLVASLT